MTDYHLIKDYSDGDLSEFTQINSPGWANDGGIMKATSPGDGGMFRDLVSNEALFTNGCIRAEFEYQPKGEGTNLFFFGPVGIGGAGWNSSDPGPWAKPVIGFQFTGGQWQYATTPYLGAWTILNVPLGISLTDVWTPVVITIENCCYTIEVEGATPISTLHGSQHGVQNGVCFQYESDADHWMRNLKLYRPDDVVLGVGP